METNAENMSRPRIEVPWGAWDWVLELVGLAGLVMLLVVPAFYYQQLPESIPVHFNFQGQPDSFGPRETIWILPTIGTVLFLLMSIANQSPHTFNYTVKIDERNAEVEYAMATRMMRLIKALIVVVFVYLDWTSIQIALGESTGLYWWFAPAFLLALFGTVGFFVLRSRRRFLSK